MAIFKVGDIVKPNPKAWGSDRKIAEEIVEAVVRKSDPYMFSVKVTKVKEGGEERLNKEILCKTGYDAFELVKHGVETELHITTDGNTTHAALKENGKLVKRAKAVCSPDDEYSFETGARLAVDRVFGKEAEKKEPKFKFKVGNMVEVVSPSTHCYPAAIDFIKQFGEDYLARFAYHSRPTKGILYTVRQRAEWKMGNGEKKKLYVIEEFNIFVGFYGAYYIVDEEGLVKAS